MSEPKGFAPWNPRAEYLALIPDVIDVILRLEDYWPLTQRGYLYRLMSWHGWKKSQEPKLQYILNRGRRSGLIPWEAVASKRGTRVRPYTFHSARQMAQSAIHRVDYCAVDRQQGQDQRLVLWIEQDGLVPLLEDVADQYGLPVFSGQGFDTIGPKHDFAVEVSESDRPVKILHVGDCDSSGLEVWRSMMLDIQAYLSELGGDLSVDRIALLDAHIDEYDLYWEPQKDNGSNHGLGLHCPRWAQAEALEPQQMIELVEQAIVTNIDRDTYDAALALESEYQGAARAALLPALEEL